MLETSGRLLRLLSLLQSGRSWSGRELAERLGVTDRTLRTDVARLRALEYPVEATPGAAGGYRLGSGGRLPPLLLDDEEAVAVVVGLRSATGGGVTGAGEAALRALAKLEQMLPARLRARVTTLAAASVAVPSSGPTVDADVLVAVASAVRAHERLRFDYTSWDGTSSRRDVEPHRLVSLRGRWYLLAWDRDRDDWRSFRVDRLRPRIPTGPRFEPRDLPDQEAGAIVQRAAATAPWHVRARVRLHAPAAVVRPRLPAVIEVRPESESTCVMDVGSDTPELLALHIGLLGVDFDVVEGDELRAHLSEFASRLMRAAARSSL